MTTDSTQQAHYGGIPEHQGWAHAPLGPPAFTFIVEVDAPDQRAAAKAALRNYFPWHRIENTRANTLVVRAVPVAAGKTREGLIAALNEARVRRYRLEVGKAYRTRDIGRLPEAFMRDAVKAALPAIRGAFSRSRLYAPDELQSLTCQLAMDLLCRFDEQRGTPWMAYVHSTAKLRASDPLRRAIGRQASDTLARELRVFQDCSTEQSDAAAKAATADVLGLTVPQLRDTYAEAAWHMKSRAAVEFAPGLSSGMVLDLDGATSSSDEHSIREVIEAELASSATPTRGHTDQVLSTALGRALMAALPASHDPDAPALLGAWLWIVGRQFDWGPLPEPHRTHLDAITDRIRQACLSDPTLAGTYLAA